MTGLALQAITKKFGDFKAVDHVDLDVPQGTFVCLLGPSGCGKTTLLRMIAGLEEPTSGKVVIDGQDITGTATHARDFGMVFQSLALFPHLNVGQNIAYPLRIRGASKAEQAARVDELLKLIHLNGFAERPVAKLSGGQRQRVAIARALASRPSILVADEPVSMLDVSIRLGVLTLLAELQREEGLGVLYITHDLATARHFSDEIMVLHHGKVVEHGPADDVILNPQHPYTRELRAASPDPEKHFASATPQPFGGVE